MGSWASNNWVLDGSKTKSGKPLLANDPHLSFSAPGLWYLAHLSWQGSDGEQHNLVGSTIPAVPAVILGRNNDLAWGFTNAGGDVQDLYVERIDPQNPNQYITESGSFDFITKEEVIKVKGATDIGITVRSSRNGPILPPSFRNHGEYLREGQVVALRWTGLSKRDKSFDVVTAIGSAKTVQEFGSLVSETVAPMQAIVVADTKGSIGLFAPAALPIRSSENRAQGRQPVPGWDPEYAWKGMVAPQNMPRVINPENGAIGTANSRFVDNNISPMITLDWDETFRHDRVQQTMVQANAKLGVENMAEGQNDTYSPGLADLRDVLLRRMDSRPTNARLVELLRSWDGNMVADKPEPLIMMAFMRNAHAAIFEDDIGPSYDSVFTAPATTLIRVLNEGGARNWCKTAKSSANEQCGVVLAKAFDKTINELKSQYGDSPDDWRWGKAHKVVNEHQPFGRVWPLSLFFNIEREADGGSYTLLRAKPGFRGDKPYNASHGAGYRAIYDFEDLEKSKYISSTGQSGNAFSPRYSDQSDIWIKGGYLEISTNPDVFGNDALGEWSLLPK